MLFLRKGENNVKLVRLTLRSSPCTGPYAPAVFRFRVHFPGSYPSTAPLVIFTSDVFHPLIAPLTTASFSSSFSDADADGNAPEERLPPGALNLRHKFSQWKQRSDSKLRGRPTSLTSSPATPVSKPAPVPETVRDSGVASDNMNQTHVIDVLTYVRSSFEDDTVLDALPFEAAANQGAWYAWRAHRAKLGVKGFASPAKPGNKREGKERTGPRHPSEWNWEGVWVDRVRKAVQGSLSEPVLYGSGGTGRDDDIHFRAWSDGEEEFEEVQIQIHHQQGISS